MSKYIVTFGQDHVHHIYGKTFDHNCVARVEAETEDEAREIFMPRFCFSYPEEFFDEDSLKHYPRGYVDL